MISESDTKPSASMQVLSLIGWLLLCFAAASSGVFVSTGDWYASLNKPSWNPPSWLFGPVWSVLYCMMAVAAWLVWCEAGFRSQKIPLRLFLVQLGLNALWTPLFFGLHLPGLALAEMVLLWLLLAATLRTFWQVSPIAGVLLIPYLFWISFAAVLNFTLWRINT